MLIQQKPHRVIRDTVHVSEQLSMECQELQARSSSSDTIRFLCHLRISALHSAFEQTPLCETQSLGLCCEMGDVLGCSEEICL